MCTNSKLNSSSDAHITLLEYEGLPPPSWNPTELQAGFKDFLRRFVQGYSCLGMTWSPRKRHDDPWRFVMTVDGNLALRMQVLRDDVAFELGFQVGVPPPGYFHLGLNGLGPLPGTPDAPVRDYSWDPWWQQHTR